MHKSEMQAIRGDHISMIFQQPTSSLNPVHRTGAQIREVFELHRDWSDAVREEKVVEMLTRVGIPDPLSRRNAFPHELSGGMAQRVMIAMALACESELLIADEPTTALDVTIQAQILDLIRDLQKSSKTAVILITRDLGVVAEMADRVAVMYAGQIVEETDVARLFKEPLHPYTKGLIGSIPAARSPSRVSVMSRYPSYCPPQANIPTLQPAICAPGRTSTTTDLCSGRRLRLPAPLRTAFTDHPHLCEILRGRCRVGVIRTCFVSLLQCWRPLGSGR